MDRQQQREVDRLMRGRVDGASPLQREVDRYIVVLAEAKGAASTSPNEAARVIERVLGKDRVKSNAKPSRAPKPNEMPVEARFG